MPTHEVNGTTLYYAERGSGPALVLLHGFPLDSRVYEAQLSGLSDSCRVITPDLRGFGQSASRDAFTVESLADDVHALLEALGALPCVLGGLSMGGYVALAYAAKYPADLRGLVLIDTKAEADSADAKAGRQKMIDLARASGAEAVADQMLPKMLAPSNQQDPLCAEALRRMMEACPPLTIEHALLAMRDRPDRSAELGSIRAPVLIVVGEHDAITPPAVAEAMAKPIPDARVVFIRDAGHMTPMERPEGVNREIGAFVERLGLDDGLNGGA